MIVDRVTNCPVVRHNYYNNNNSDIASSEGRRRYEPPPIPSSFTGSFPPPPSPLVPSYYVRFLLGTAQRARNMGKSLRTHIIMISAACVVQ